MSEDLHKITAQFISGENDSNILVQSFVCKDVIKAMAFVTALGLYELKLNGKKVGNEYLTPYFDDYSKALQVQKYDITGYLKNENLVEIEVADGWCCGRFGLDKKQNIYADKPAALLQIELTDINGNTRTIGTDASWNSKKSKTVFSGIYDGEIVDTTIDNDKTGKVTIIAYDKTRLIPPISPPVTLKETFEYDLVCQTENEFILDFKQNFAGIIEFTDHLNYGQTIKITHGEILQNGEIYTENLRTATGVYQYTGCGNGETVTPKFTYFGFRYAKIEGVENIDKLQIKGRALYSTIEQISSFHCSNDNINRLFSNVLFSLKSNSIDIPTDCPQRDERLGWTGDVSMFCKTASLLCDMREFYNKYLFDVRIGQGSHGEIFNYYPTAKENCGTSNVWGDLICILPDVLFSQYGEIDAFKENYSAMKKWINFVTSKTENLLVKNLFQFGDWLALDGVDENSFKGATDDVFIASVFYYNSTVIAAKAAETLGFEKDKQYFADLGKKIKDSIIHEYFTPTGRFALDTQTALVLLLWSGIYIHKEIVVKALKYRLERDSYKLETGFVGTRYILEVLADNGMGNIANEILFNDEYPGWLNEIKLGATTVWERWNSMSQDGIVAKNGMNSFNHYAYGSVASYLIEYLAGIKVAKNVVIIKPQFDIRMKQLTCSRWTNSGNIMVDFSFDNNGECHFNCDIPVDAEAILVLPDRKIQLTNGKNTLQFKVQCLTTPYDINTPLLFIKNNANFITVIKETSPVLFGILRGNNMELLSKSLIEICKMPFLNIEDKTLDELNKKIKECDWS